MNTDKEVNPITEHSSFEDLEKLDWNVFVKEVPHGQELWAEIEEINKQGFMHWAKIVHNIAGEKDAETLKTWWRDYKLNLNDFLMDMVVEAVRLEQSTIKKIKDLLIQLQTLCIELQEPIPNIGSGTLSLFEEQAKLMECLKQYEDIINQKKSELKMLQDKQEELCKQLEEEPKMKLKYPPLPTQSELAKFQQYIDKLENEKFEREEKYCALKDEIMELVKELGYKPKDDFEKKVMTSNKAYITKNNMERIEFFAKSLKEIMKQTKEDISQLRVKIEDLWKMLDVNLMDRDEFRTHFKGNSLATLDALWLEVKRCENIRKANIKMFIEKLRVELKTLWEKCHCSELVRRQFKYFNDECFTEDLLDLHEIEIQKWKTYYEENSNLLELLNKHRELWQKGLQLEENATGPDRYKNRGGKLLMEEKERNKLAKQIPKIEDEIRVLSEQFREKNFCSFYTFGNTPEEYIDHMHLERENNRQLKLSARKLQRENTMLTPAKSSRNLFPSTSRAALTPSTPATASKRKIFATPSTDSKRTKIANTPISRSKTPRVIPKIKITHTHMVLPSQKRRSSVDKSRRSVGKCKKSRVENKENHDINNTTYTEFQSDLSCKKNVRSTILPGDILTNTPCKPSRGKRTKPA
ncbi:protein regulator of cytokinesis 1-like [Anthonomus grandis grandis]|uniref:protein regulator of cytokinesis 1-like n=1 Tax=Anthonomus grandis grandis TaxID=2921223 RepID=UPI00216659AE|nr:protein regulator of cytokinesis 1-like [Anthonomus grandis grandis]